MDFGKASHNIFCQDKKKFFDKNKIEKIRGLIMKKRCPHCHKMTEVKDFGRAKCYAENYGSGYLVFECQRCTNKIEIYFQRFVKCVSIEKAKPDADLSYSYLE